MFSFRKKIIGKNNKKIIFLICGWPGKIWHYYLTAKILERKGFQSIIYEYDESILSSSIENTIKNTYVIKNDVLKEIINLKKIGCKDFSIFGTSYGNIISFIIANKEKSISKLIINLVGSDLAETVWTWNKGRDGLVKKGIKKQNISLNNLKQKWAELSPINNINNLKKLKVLFYLAKKDDVIPFRMQNKLLTKLSKVSSNIKIVINNKDNHLISALINLIKYKIYVNFLLDYKD